MTYKKIKLLTIVVLLGLLATSCSPKNNVAVNETPEIAIPVQVAETNKGSLQHLKTVVGNASPNLDISIYSELSGKIADVKVQKGEKVVKGQIIATLKQEDFLNAVAQAEAQLKTAQANLTQAESSRGTSVIQSKNQVLEAQTMYENAKINYERTKSLFENEAVPKTQLEQAENSLVQAEVKLNIAKETYENALGTENIEVVRTQVETAKVALDNAKLNLEKTYIKAPADGTVVEVEVDNGELVSPQMPIAKIIDLNPIKVTASITEDELIFIAEGKEIAINIKTLAKKITGNVSFISPMADEKTKTYPIEITINNDDETIKPGMIAELYLQPVGEENDILVPTDAIVKDKSGTYIFIVKDNVAEKRNVDVKETGSEYSVVSKGLTEGETVVIKGQLNLKSGDKVRVIEGGEYR